MYLPCMTDRSNKLNAVARTQAQARDEEHVARTRIVGGKVDGGEALLKITNWVLFISYTLYKS